MSNRTIDNYKNQKEVIQNGCWNCEHCTIIDCMLNITLYFCSTQYKKTIIKNGVIQRLTSTGSIKETEYMIELITPVKNKFKTITFRDREVVEKFGICNNHKSEEE